jgi:hypothetical protein
MPLRQNPAFNQEQHHMELGQPIRRHTVIPVKHTMPATELTQAPLPSIPNKHPSPSSSPTKPVSEPSEAA